MTTKREESPKKNSPGISHLLIPLNELIGHVTLAQAKNKADPKADNIKKGI